MSSFLPANNTSLAAQEPPPVHDASTPRPVSLPTTTTTTPSTTEDSSRPSTAKGFNNNNNNTTTSSDEMAVVLAESDDVDRDASSDHDQPDTAGSNDVGPPSKKKKGQRFFCTDFPPCNLSFTRSEHLARHIRKHTGERPFQCHCSRRFSRLDNLRQHAQTVHVNEDIPGDSLAATGTRFQRQIRTDRVRPQGRARAGTVGSAVTTSTGQGLHSRGHSRNLSASSITSTASSSSPFSHQPPDFRRRPAPPLIMANDGSSSSSSSSAAARARLTLDTMADAATAAAAGAAAPPPPPTTPPSQIRGFPGPSVGGSSPYTTSTPSIFTTANGASPSHFASPVSAISHAGFWDGRTPTRRLSVPAGTNPFLQHHPGCVYPFPPPPPPPPSSYMNSATAATVAPAVYSNTPPGIFANYHRPESSAGFSNNNNNSSSAAEAEMRRRTWHPSTYSTLPRPVSSGFDGYHHHQHHHHHPQHQPLQPSFVGVNGSGEPPPRLPGIESFDKILSQQQRPITPPARKLTPMDIDSDSRGGGGVPPPPSFVPGFNNNTSVRPPPPISGPGHRRGHVSWDLSLHQNLTGLNIRDRTPQRDASHWSQQTIAEIQNVGSRPSSSHHHHHHQHHQHHHHQHASSVPAKPTGWYPASAAAATGSTPNAAATGPSTATRTSPEDSSSSEGAPTPSTTASLEYHPTIVHSSGYDEPHQQHLPTDISQGVCAAPLMPHSGNYHDHLGPTAQQSGLFPDPQNRDSGMGRLEALVAVATREDQSATKLVL